MTKQDIFSIGERDFLVAPFCGSYDKVRKDIENAGLRMPTFQETADFVCYVEDRGNYERKNLWYDLRFKFRSSFLHTSNGFLYVPNSGWYSQDLPNICEGKILMDEENLKTRLRSGDPNVKFVASSGNSDPCIRNLLKDVPRVFDFNLERLRDSNNQKITAHVGLGIEGNYYHGDFFDSKSRMYVNEYIRWNSPGCAFAIIPKRSPNEK